jgi:MFS family permease
VFLLLWCKRSALELAPAKRATTGAVAAEGNLDFLRIPAVWMCFAFFLVYAGVLTGVQAYAPQAARHLHDVPVAVAALCVTVFMVCSAGGVVLGGFLASDPSRCERVVGVGFGAGALIAAALSFATLPAAVIPALFGAMGFASGIAGPSRDMLVKRSTPENASGRVYGVVYSGLDVGQAIAPLIFGALLDRQQWHGVWLVVIASQLLLIASAFRVRRVRRTVLVPA